MRSVALGTDGITIPDLVAVAHREARLELSASARRAIVASERALRSHLASGTAVYGLTSGVGALDGFAVQRRANPHHQASLLRSHAAGVGTPLEAVVVRGMIAARVAAFARGMSAVHLGTVEALLAMLDRDVTPVVPSLGSVGASDLVPLAHAALPLLGEGRASYGGEILSGSEAFARAGITPPELGPRDGLALLNGLSLTAAVGALTVAEAQVFAEAMEAVGALGLVALGGLATSFEERSVRARPHPGALASAKRIRGWLEASSDPPTRTDDSLREPLSYRLLHQTTGALIEAIEVAHKVVSQELAAAADNPLVAEDGWTNSNVANFDGHRVALALDGLNAAFIGAAAASERRTARLLDPVHNRGLPPFLVHPDAQPGVSSGLMIAQYTAAAIVAELRVTSSPVTGQTIPTCNGTEDVVSMAAIAARRVRSTMERAFDVGAVELLAAGQATDLSRSPLPHRLMAVHQRLRREIPCLIEDRVLGEDLAMAVALLKDPTFFRTGAPPAGRESRGSRRRARGHLRPVHGGRRPPRSD